MEKLSLNEMLQSLYEKLEDKSNQIKTEDFHIFLSATDGRQRAIVVNEKANKFAESWKKTTQSLKKQLFMKKVKPQWLKADIVTSIALISFPQLMNDLGSIRKNHFRQGISFDKNFNNAFLEQEVNGNVFFHPWEKDNVKIHLQNVNYYIKQFRDTSFRVHPDRLREVFLFDTVSAFHDGYEIHEQHEEMIHHGARKLSNFTEVFKVMNNASEYITNQLQQNGQFQYINFPTFNKSVKGYNVIYHASTVYALIEVYRVTKNKNLIPSIDSSLKFLIEECTVIHEIQGHQFAFVIEKEQNNEIKLGANAFTMMALVSYAEVFETNTYEGKLGQLVNGILYFKKEDGSFVHVLHEDATIKDVSRTDFYEGQAVWALIRLYQLIKNEDLLTVIKQNFSHFIKNEQWKKGDPWLARASAALYKILPDEQYAIFHLQNTKRMLDTAFTADSEATTMLELLMSTYELVEHMNKKGIELEELEQFEVKKLHKAIVHRVNFQLSNYVWPEMAMYFAVPENVVDAFFVRHDSFRIRIDDIANNLLGFVYYYEMMEQKESSIQYNDQFLLETNMIHTAKFYERQHKWTDAIDCFTAHWGKRKYWMDFTYYTYATYLHKNGETNRAKEVLAEGNKLHPESEKILAELLNLCMTLNDWQSAVSVSEELIKVTPKKGKYYLELGRAYAQLRERTGAEAAFKVGLIYHHEMSTEQLIERIQQRIVDDSTKIQTKYTFLGGMNNLGVLLHEYEDEQYITKITRIDDASLREKLFYKHVLADNEVLKDIVPAFIDDHTMDNIQYLTIEKIDSMKKKIDIIDIINTAQKIAKVPYDELINKYPNPDYVHKLRRNIGPDIVYFLSQIHEKFQSENLFATAKMFANQHGFSEDVMNMINRLEMAILRHQLYKHIIPEKHYTLQHSDFKLDNMSVRASDESIVVLDWGSFSIAPRFMDMVTMFGNLPTPLEEIKKEYLHNEDVGLELVEQIYFLLGYFFMYFVKLNEKNMENLANKMMLPAVEELELLVEKLVSS